MIEILQAEATRKGSLSLSLRRRKKEASRRGISVGVSGLVIFRVLITGPVPFRL